MKVLGFIFVLERCYEGPHVGALQVSGCFQLSGEKFYFSTPREIVACPTIEVLPHAAKADPGWGPRSQSPFSKIMTSVIYDKIRLLTKELGKENSYKCSCSK